ncbi:MAG: hypothetical protein HY717_00300 [Planctomycetes bacterium]|nr:hypothetical protein [Planctomycetota bacterium]
MSTLAKIFVVFNLLLTVAFFGTSGTLFYTRKNYLDIYQKAQDAHTSQLGEIEVKFNTQKAQLDLIAQQNSALKATSAELAAKNKNLDTEKHDLATKLDSKEQQVKTTADSLTQAHKTLQDLEAGKTRLEQALAEAKKASDDAVAAREKAIRDVTRLKLDYDKLNGLYSQLQIAKNELQGKAEEMEIERDNLQKQFPDIFKSGGLGLNVPSIPGRIEAVNDKDKLVVLSVGKDQKVQEGYKFYVRRGAVFIGKVTVIKVYDDLSGARVEYLSGTKTIEVGDEVNTTF